MITREQLDMAAIDFDDMKKCDTWWTERGRGENNVQQSQIVGQFRDTIFTHLAERMMWEWLVRDLGPEVALRETLEKFDRMMEGTRDILSQGLQVFYLEQTGVLTK